MSGYIGPLFIIRFGTFVVVLFSLDRAQAGTHEFFVKPAEMRPVSYLRKGRGSRIRRAHY